MNIDLDDASRELITAWAAATNCVREIWLFGSRARGDSRPDSDIDLAILLMPPSGKTNWAYGDYCGLGDQWKQQLITMLGRHISLEAICAGSDGYDVVMREGYCLWSRAEAS